MSGNSKTLADWSEYHGLMMQVQLQMQSLGRILATGLSAWAVLVMAVYFLG